MSASELITLSRACEVIEIPSGTRGTLPAGAVVRIMQSLAGSYTVATDRGYMYRVEAKDTDALGLSNAALAQEPAVREGPVSEQMVWDQLKTVYDPEIPVNIVDLGLVYSCLIAPVEQGGNRVHIKMSMTAPGCGMGNVLKADVETKLSRLPGVKEVHVEVVFDPPWHPASCRTRPSSSLASTWITAQHKPRERLIEKESNHPHLAQKIPDLGAGLETFACAVTKPATIALAARGSESIMRKVLYPASEGLRTCSPHLIRSGAYLCCGHIESHSRSSVSLL